MPRMKFRFRTCLHKKANFCKFYISHTFKLKKIFFLCIFNQGASSKSLIHPVYRNKLINCDSVLIFRHWHNKVQQISNKVYSKKILLYVNLHVRAAWRSLVCDRYLNKYLGFWRVRQLQYESMFSARCVSEPHARAVYVR